MMRHITGMNGELGKMFSAQQIIIDNFIELIRDGYRQTFGGLHPEFGEITGWAGRMALGSIANSSAMYHDVEHTIQVTLVGQELIRGKQIREPGVSSEDWLHVMISLVCHDIGYVKGVCRQDKPGIYATGRNGETVQLPEESTDAALTPYHVDRGKLFIDERFGGHSFINPEIIKENIELTRFPVPGREDRGDDGSFSSLVRAADLIGQLSDLGYLRKIPRLFAEFAETGVASELGYKTPSDLRKNYPKFFWGKVYPFVKGLFPYLMLTHQGKQILAMLHSNVFVVEHGILETF